MSHDFPQPRLPGGFPFLFRICALLAAATLMVLMLNVVKNIPSSMLRILFGSTMLVLSLFILLSLLFGMVVPRLRDIGLPAACALLIFVPIVNLLFLILLTFLRTDAEGQSKTSFHPFAVRDIHPPKNYAILLLLLCSGVFLSAKPLQGPGVQTLILIGNQGKRIQAQVPDSWQQQVSKADDKSFPSVSLTSPSDTVELKIRFLAIAYKSYQSERGLQDLMDVIHIKDKRKASAAEKRALLKPLISKFGHGYYLTSDYEVKKPFSLITNGAFALQFQLADFEIHSHDITSPEFEEALQIVREGLSD